MPKLLRHLPWLPSDTVPWERERKRERERECRCMCECVHTKFSRLTWGQLPDNQSHERSPNCAQRWLRRPWYWHCWEPVDRALWLGLWGERTNTSYGHRRRQKPHHHGSTHLSAAIYIDASLHTHSKHDAQIKNIFAEAPENFEEIGYFVSMKHKLRARSYDILQ